MPCMHTHLQDRHDIAETLAARGRGTHGDVPLLQQRHDGLHLVAEELRGGDAEAPERGADGRVQLERQHAAARGARRQPLDVHDLALVVGAGAEVVEEGRGGEGRRVEAGGLVALSVDVAQRCHRAVRRVCTPAAALMHGRLRLDIHDTVCA